MASTNSVAADCRIWLGRQRERLRLWRRHHRNERILRDCAGVVKIRIHAPLAGLGAHFNMAVLMLTTCQRRGVIPRFRFTSPLYGAEDGNVDWLQPLYRQPRGPCEIDGPELLITRWDDMSWSFRSRCLDQRRAVSRLVHAHFQPARAVAARVASLAETLFQGSQTLGVHYRGTDKASEARFVPVGEMVASIRKLLIAHSSLRRVFVATDSADFVLALGREIDGRPVVSAPAVERSSGTEGVHFKHSKNRIARAEQALVDALLLERCAYLLKTESGLSQWTTLLNPDLPVLQLNARYHRPQWASWFPLELFDAADRPVMRQNSVA